MINKRFGRGVAVLIAIIVITIGATVFSIIKGSSTESNSFNTINLYKNSHSPKANVRTPNSEYIAILYIEGTIQPENYTYNQAWLLKTIERLKNDSKNVAILLYIDSPGGTVYEADEAYLALQNYKTSGKKIFCYLGSMAASGGYYIACAADEIFANRNTLTGSIGVVMGQSIDLTEFFAKHGIKYTTIHAGKNKNMGNYNEPLSNEQREILQSIADECYDQFTSIVATSRKLPYNEVYKIADGRIYSANQALKNGLIDGIDGFEQYCNTIINEKLENPLLKTVTFRYEKQRGFFDSVLGIVTKIKGEKADTLEGIPEAVWEQMNIKEPMYLY